MFWLAVQIFVLCLLSFLVGAGITVVALRLRPTTQRPTTQRPTTQQPTTQQVVQQEELVEEEEPDDEPAPAVIKASKKSMRYHTPDSPYYDRVSGSLTFVSTQEAELAGYKPWNADKVKTPTA